MLTLNRRIGETIVLGDEVQVTVLGIKGNQVRLGISAPTSITVYREEIYKKIQTEMLIDGWIAIDVASFIKNDGAHSSHPF